MLRWQDRCLSSCKKQVTQLLSYALQLVESSWNVVAQGDAREGKWRGNWRMEWVASTLHTTSEHGVSSITTADAHTSAASSRLNWRSRRFKWTRPFRRKTESGFCTCAITFQLAPNICKPNIQSNGKEVMKFTVIMITSSIMVYAFFWVIPRRLNFIYRRFGTLCLFHLHRRVGMSYEVYFILHTYLPMKMEQIVFRNVGI